MSVPSAHKNKIIKYIHSHVNPNKKHTPENIETEKQNKKKCEKKNIAKVWKITLYAKKQPARAAATHKISI